jgi:hypothetical protein
MPNLDPSSALCAVSAFKERISYGRSQHGTISRWARAAGPEGRERDELTKR